MPLVRGLTATSALLLLLVVVVLSSSAPAASHATAHDVTTVLPTRRGLAEFSRALTATGLADSIDGLQDAVTVLAVDNARMAALKARGLPREALRRALSRHVLVGCYDGSRLRRLLTGAGGSTDVVAPTLLDGAAVRIARRGRGSDPWSVAFVPVNDPRAAVFYMRPVHDAPRNVSVLLVSGVMWSPAAAPPESGLPKPLPAPAPLVQSLSRTGASSLLSPDAVTSTTTFQAPSDVALSRSAGAPRTGSVATRDGARATVLPVQQVTPRSVSALQESEPDAASPPEPRPAPSTAAAPAPPDHYMADVCIGAIFGILLACYLVVCLCSQY